MINQFEELRRTPRDRVSSLFFFLSQNQVIWDPPAAPRLERNRIGRQVYRPEIVAPQDSVRNPYSYIYYAKGESAGFIRLLLIMNV